MVLVQAIRGLRAARTVHRDIKPENLLLTKGSKGKFLVGDIVNGINVKLCDFGLARGSAGMGLTTLTRTGQVMGTAFYMSP